MLGRYMPALEEYELILRNTFSRVVYENGDTYEGEFSKGYRHGEGTYNFSDPAGTRYEGSFVKDQFQGYGEYYYARDVYCGQWANSCKHGDGTYRDKKNGVTYTGQWVEGFRHGKGKIEDKHGVYQGDLRADLRHGQGTMTWKNGDEFSGQWENEMRHGEGSMKTAKESYEGQWENDKRHGKAVQIIKGEGVYTGQFVDGSRHGDGTLAYEDGGKFEGVFEAGERRKGLEIGKDGKKEYTIYLRDVIVGREQIPA